MSGRMSAFELVTAIRRWPESPAISLDDQLDYQQRCQDFAAALDRKNTARIAARKLIGESEPSEAVQRLATEARQLAESLPDAWMPGQCEAEWRQLRTLIRSLSDIALSGLLTPHAPRLNAEHYAMVKGERAKCAVPR